jgi:hypothetical protein
MLDAIRERDSLLGCIKVNCLMLAGPLRRCILSALFMIALSRQPTVKSTARVTRAFENRLSAISLLIGFDILESIDDCSREQMKR